MRFWMAQWVMTMKTVHLPYERDDSELLTELARRLRSDQITNGWYARDMKLRERVKELLHENP